MPINTPTGYLDITNATLRGSKIVTTGFVGIANANPTNHLSIGSNLHINDTHSNVLQISGNINAASVVLGGISIAPTFDLEIVTNTGNTTPYTVEFNNAATAFVTTANATIGDTLTASKLVGDGSGISAIQSSNVSDFGSNVSRITTLETDLGNNSARITNLSSNLSDNSARITNLSSNLSDNSARITNLSSNLSDNSSRITALESGDISISGDKTFTGDIVFESNVHMNSGNVFVANTVNLTVSDPIIELGSNNSGTNDLGIIMTRPNNNSNVAVVFDESVDILRMGYTLNGANDTVVDLDSNALAVSVQGALTAGSNLEVGTANLFVDTTTSNVGVGVSSPAYKLDVGGDINIASGSNLRIGGSIPVFSRWTASGSDIYRPSDNVGIGVAPSHKLDVAGDINFTGSLLQNGSAFQGSKWSTSGSDIYRSSGNVGIGTASPLQTLHVAGNGQNPVIYMADSSNTRYASGMGTHHVSNEGQRLDFYNGDSGANGTSLGSSHIRMSITSTGNVGIGTTSPGGLLDINGLKTKFRYEYRFQDAWDSNNNQTFTIPVSGGNARGLMLVEAKVIQVAANSSAERVARVKGMIANYHTGNQYMTVLEGENVSAFETYIVGTSISASGTFTLKYRPQEGYLQNVKCRLYLKIWYGGYTNSFGDLTRTDTGSNSALTAPTFNSAPKTFGGNVGIGTASPGIVLDVGSSLSNPQIGRNYATGSVHDADKRDAIYFGRWDGTGRDFLGIKCRVDTHTALGYGDYSNQTKLEFYTWGNNYASSREVMCIRGDGNVGIGTASPSAKLHINTGATEGATFTKYETTGNGYGGIEFRGTRGNGTNGSTIGQISSYWQNNTRGSIIFNDGGDISILPTRNVGIGTASPDTRLTLKQSEQSASGGFQIQRSENTSSWQIYINANGTDLYFAYNGTTKGYLDRVNSAGLIDFTGQHRSFIYDVPYSKYTELEGLIVSANKNKYFTIGENIHTGSNAIQISESLPLVSLSTKPLDKACFGVISGTEDPETRKYAQGTFTSVMNKQEGDVRAFINSLGEGAIWVTNANGPLESGDYITTSNVAGYGMKQEDDVLHNYTVAKITMDCDFAPVDEPIQQIVKERANVNYWVNTTYSNVALEEYSNLAEENRTTVDTEMGTIYQKIERDERKEEPTEEGFVLEVREELVNVLDEHGQLQWEDHPTDTEKAYKIRYLDASGQITDEANVVHTAAFVGCTYHCG